MKANGQAAIVTGGGSGLGAGTARALAAAGAKVAVLDINEEQAKAVADEIGGIALGCDVSSASAAEEAVAAAAEAHGDARILINCAGIANASRIVGREAPHDLELFSRVINVNLIGSFNLLRLVAARAHCWSRWTTMSGPSSSRRHRLQPLTARSARQPTRHPRAASIR